MITVIGLDWQDQGCISVSNPLYLAYNDEKQNVVLPAIQFIAKAEYTFDAWYPIIIGFDESGIVFKKTFRKMYSWTMAKEYAKELVELALQGEYEDGKTSHFVLNDWCYQIAKNLKLVEIGT